MRRTAIVVALLLAGCGPSHQERLAAYDRQMGGPPPPLPASAQARMARDAQAAAICEARAEMAGATYAGRGFGMVGALSAGAEAAIAADRVRAACLGAYQATGLPPAP